MKVRESHWHEAAKADKNDRSDRSNNDGAATARRQQTGAEHSGAANKGRQKDSPLKDEAKFADFLESTPKLQKPNRQKEDAGEQRNDDRKKEKKDVGKRKEATDASGIGEDKTGKYESFGGQSGGAGSQSGFGAGANVNQLSLSDNFAARSILHIADLERLVSTVRTQTSLGGRREIVLQMKQSVLEGLQVKISTGAAAGVEIEFLAANENVRSQVSAHAQELAGILRGRGINLASLSASVDTKREDQNSSDGIAADASGLNSVTSAGIGGTDNSSEDDTFGTSAPGAGDKIYQA